MIKFLIKKAVLPVFGLMLGLSSAHAALNCVEQPECANLGYSMTDVANCESYIKCPFNQAYKACIRIATTVDCTGYTHAFCPVNAMSCSACGTGTDVKYKVDSCKDGYALSGGTCIVNSCSEYTLNYCPTGGICTTCLSGTTTKYKFDGCNAPYVRDGNSCYDCATKATELKTITRLGVYAKCLSSSNCSYDCTPGRLAAWDNYCICKHIGNANCLTMVGPGDKPLIPDGSGGNVSVFCDTDRCLNASDLMNKVIKAHNTKCSSGYQVTDSVYFSCNVYIPEGTNAYATVCGIN